MLPLRYSTFVHRNIIDKRANGYKRRMESIRKSTEVMFDLLRQTQEYGVGEDIFFSTVGLPFRLLFAGLGSIASM